MKQILIHIGPHKTGSTAIQRYLVGNRLSFAAQGTEVMHNELTHSVAVQIAKRKYEEAARGLSGINELMERSTASSFLLSQEDFSGDLLGRGPSRKVYPCLARNLKLLDEAFVGFDVRYVFFQRAWEDWIRSCYAQVAKYRDRFGSLEDYRSFVKGPLGWELVLEPAREYAGSRLRIVDYSGSDKERGVHSILELLGISKDAFKEDVLVNHENTSQDLGPTEVFERINRLAEMKKMIPLYKAISKNLLPDQVEPSSGENWPPRVEQRKIKGLEGLQKRVKRRVPDQPDAIDLLPPETCDLGDLRTSIIDRDASLPDVTRHDFRDQVDLLKYHLRGKSELALLNALVISYLRRNTPHTAKARTLFQRIWREEGNALRYELSTRWIISTLQTFLDHGINEGQRVIGASGFFYANMIKIYEGERSIEGRDQDETYPSTKPQTDNKFRGLDRFEVGGTDLLLNTNAHALEVCSLDPVAGRVLEEFLLRVKMNETVFSRFDRTRLQKKIDVPNFTDTWSFFEVP